MNIVRFLFLLIIIFILVVAVMNQSISSYIEQKYHIAFYPQNDVLKEASALKNKLEQIRAILGNEPLPSLVKEENLEDNLSLDLNQSIQETSITNDQIKQKENNKSIADENASFIDLTKVKVKDGEEFLLIGDSLMQSVAIALNRDLKQFDIKVTDLSKQNTGLSYKSYFNWANATKQAFAKNRNIKYLVVLLGANDPWNIKKGGEYHRFNSPTWREIYIDRIDEIIRIAKRNKAKVFWYEIPPIKEKSLNEKTQILNQLYSQEILKNKEIFISTKMFFSVRDAFSSYIKDENNKSIKVRTDDGVHFTPAGAREMSKLLIEHLETKEVNNE